MRSSRRWACEDGAALKRRGGEIRDGPKELPGWRGTDTGTPSRCCACARAIEIPGYSSYEVVPLATDQITMAERATSPTSGRQYSGPLLCQRHHRNTVVVPPRRSLIFSLGGSGPPRPIAGLCRLTHLLLEGYKKVHGPSWIASLPCLPTHHQQLHRSPHLDISQQPHNEQAHPPPRNARSPSCYHLAHTHAGHGQGHQIRLVLLQRRLYGRPHPSQWCRHVQDYEPHDAAVSSLQLFSGGSGPAF